MKWDLPCINLIWFGSRRGAPLPRSKVRVYFRVFGFSPLGPPLFELQNTQMVYLSVKLLAAKTDIYYSQGGGARYPYPKHVWTPAGLYTLDRFLPF